MMFGRQTFTFNFGQALNPSRGIRNRRTDTEFDDDLAKIQTSNP